MEFHLTSIKRIFGGENEIICVTPKEDAIEIVDRTEGKAVLFDVYNYCRDPLRLIREIRNTDDVCPLVIYSASRDQLHEMANQAPLAELVDAVLEVPFTCREMRTAMNEAVARAEERKGSDSSRSAVGSGKPGRSGASLKGFVPLSPEEGKRSDR